MLARTRDRRIGVGSREENPGVVGGLGSPLPIYPRRRGSPISYGTSSIALICLPLSAFELCFAAAMIPFAFWVCADAVHFYTQQL